MYIYAMATGCFGSAVAVAKTGSVAAELLVRENIAL
jgi:hypothetical protein